MTEANIETEALAVPAALAKENAETASKIYSPLKDEELRIVRLHRWQSSETDPVICSLITQSKHSACPYEALSYAWSSGDETYTKTISLNGEPYSVTENLYVALKGLRNGLADRWIWVDALAINQLDIPERNALVQRMREIYASASETMIWLGPGFKDDDKNLFQVVRKCRDENIAPGCETCLSKPFHHADKLLEDWRSGRVNIDDELVEFCYLKYWERVWVVQEILYSKKATLYCGQDKLSMSIFRPFWLALGTVVQDCTNPSHAAYKTYYLGHIPYEGIQIGFRPEDRLFPFRTWVQDFCERRKCSNPKDLVFGFYHCFPPELQEKFSVDYSKSEHEVFTDITRAYMEDENELSCFKYVERFARLRIGDSLPSWVPAYSQTSQFVPGAEANCRKDPGCVYFEDDGRRLCLRGICVGTMRHRYSSLSDEMCDLAENWRSTPGLGHGDARVGKLLKVIHRSLTERGVPWDLASEYLVTSRRRRHQFVDYFRQLDDDSFVGIFFERLFRFSGNESEEEMERQTDDQFMDLFSYFLQQLKEGQRSDESEKETEGQMHDLFKVHFLSDVLETLFDFPSDTAVAAYNPCGNWRELGLSEDSTAIHLAIGGPSIGNVESGAEDKIYLVRGYESPIALRCRGSSFVFLGNVTINSTDERAMWDRFHSFDDSRLEQIGIV